MIKFFGGVSRGSGDIIKYVVVCSGILCALLAPVAHEAKEHAVSLYGTQLDNYNGL